MLLPSPPELLARPKGFSRLQIISHRPSSTYIHRLVGIAARADPAIQDVDLAPALEQFPIATLSNNQGIIYSDVLDTYAFLEWICRSEVSAQNSNESFQHRRRCVLNRTLVHEGVEWMARRLQLFPLLHSGLREYMAREGIGEEALAEEFKAAYGTNMFDGEGGIYHLFAEFCDDVNRPNVNRHVPEGILSEAASFMYNVQARSGALAVMARRVEKQTPELSEEAYVMQEVGHPSFEAVRALIEKRGLRIAPVKEVREIDRLLAQLDRFQGDPEKRKRSLDELAKFVPGMNEFYDVFRLSESPFLELASGHLAAIRSRILAHLSPGNAPRRIAVVGYNQNIIAALRKIGSAYANELEAVIFVGQKPKDIMQWLKYNSQLGIFEEVEGDEKGFLSIGKQKSAISVYHGSLTEASAVLESLPWRALGVDYILISEDHARKIEPQLLERIRKDRAQLVIARTQTSDDATVLSLLNEKCSKEGGVFGIMPAEEVAYALGVSALSEMGKIFVLGADIVEKHDEPAVVQPTYRVAGVYQVIHKKNPKRFANVARMLGLSGDDTKLLATNEFKTNIPRGKLLRLNAVVNSRISREGIISLFKAKAQELEVLSLPEWWVQLTSNLNFGSSRIMFDPNQVYVSQNDAGTQVSIAFFLDEAMADVEEALRLIAGHPLRRELGEKADKFTPGMPAPSRHWARLDIAQQTEFSKRHIPRLAQKYEQKTKAHAMKRRARMYASSMGGTGTIRVSDRELTEDAVRLLFLESQPIILQEVLRDETGQAIAMVALHENRHKLYATSLLTAVSLENVHHVMGRYYDALRKYALQLSREYDWEILIHDVYEYGDKLRATIRVHHLDYNEKTEFFDRATFLSIDQYDGHRQRWQTISRPNSILYPSLPGVYNIIINAPGGRMGSCTLRIASKSDALRVIALGGPDAKRLAELLNEKDYVQGRYPGTVQYGRDWIELDGKRSLVFSHPIFRDPANYPWKCFILAGMHVHVAIDATGRFNNLDGVSRHRRAGALRAMITAPGSSKEDEWRDATFIRHINDHKYDPAKHYFLSPASCTTGCLANLNRLVEVAMYRGAKEGRFDWNGFYEVAGGMVLEGIGPTYHALTGEHIGPDIIDPIEYKKDIRRGTDATGNIFETTSGASASTALVDAAGTSHTPVYSIRFPIETVSIMAPTYVLRGHYTIEDIEAAAKVLEEACREGDHQRFQFLRDKEIDRSTQIRLLRELAEAGATLCKKNVEIVHFVAPSGEPMTVIQLIGWYENEWRPSKMYVEFLEEVMLPAEKAYQKDFTRFPYVPDVPPKSERPYSKKSSLLDLPDKAFDGMYWMVRVDHNVVEPLYDPATNRIRPSISDDHRIFASAEDIAHLVRRNARVIVMSHNGRKKDFQFLQTEDGQVIDLFSLRIAGQRLAEILRDRNVLVPERDFFMAPGVVDAQTASLARGLGPGQVLYLENLRFHEGEESGNRHFAKAIFDTLFGHLDPDSQRRINYVNSAFGASHRGLHASFLPLMNLIHGHKVLGLLTGSELETLDGILREASRPVVAFVSGVKISEKIPAVEAMIRHGAIQTFVTASPVFLVASGLPAGNSLSGADVLEVEREVAAAHRLIELAAEFDVKVVIPRDVHVAFELPDKFRPLLRVSSRVLDAESISFGSYVFDIAAASDGTPTRTASEIRAVLADAGTVIYNGTVGLYEVEQFAEGTNWIVDAIAQCPAKVKLVVGGDGVTAVNRRMGGIEAAKEKFTLCTGGGAALKYLATRTLSALDGLDERSGSA